MNRSLLLALRLKDDVLAVVPHRQWVFTIPKRLRVHFRYDRKLLGKLCRAAYDTVCDVFKLEIDGDSGVTVYGRGGADIRRPYSLAFAMCHAIVPEGVCHGVRPYSADFNIPVWYRSYLSG